MPRHPAFRLMTMTKPATMKSSTSAAVSWPHAAGRGWSLPGESLDAISRHAGKANSPVDKCLRFMADNYRRPIRIQEMAGLAGHSLRGFQRMFYEQTRSTPGATLRRMRLEEAKQLLTSTDLPLAANAGLSGYRSENTFCVAFQRDMGTSPKKFQTQFLMSQVLMLQDAARPNARRP